jgi:urease accessory protein
MGDFIGGLLHPVVTPAHGLLLLALGLLAGRSAPPPLRWPMRCFLPLSALALGVTGAGWVKALHPAVLHGALLVVGGLLAWGRPVPLPALCGLFAFAGTALGLDSAPDSTVPAAVLKTLAGTWLGLGVLVYDVAIYASLGAATSWLRHALRIAGAWLVAIALLMLAFALRPPAG